MSGVSSTVTVVLTEPTLSAAFTDTVRSAWTVIEDLLRFKCIMRESERVGANRKVREQVAAAIAAVLGARKLLLIAHEGDEGVRDHSAGRVRDRARDSAEGLLGLRGEQEGKKERERRRCEKRGDVNSLHHFDASRGVNVQKRCCFAAATVARL